MSNHSHSFEIIVFENCTFDNFAKNRRFLILVFDPQILYETIFSKFQINAIFVITGAICFII
jgi:hypothetical protein